MKRILTTGLLMALVASAAWTGILPGEPEPHSWVLEAQDPVRVHQTMQSHAAKLPPGVEARFDHAVDGLLRAVITVEDRDAATEAFVESHVTARTWLGASPRLIAAVTPDQFADLLESPRIQTVEPDFPIRFLSSESTVASNARSEHDGTGGQGTGVWTYNTTSGQLDSDISGREKPLTGANVTVAVIDSGIDKTHPDFYRWDCAPESTEQALEWHLNLTLHGTPLPCPSRIKAAVKVAPLVYQQIDKESSDTAAVDPGTAEIVQLQFDEQLPTTDHGALGHGTHVAGIVAGNAHDSPREGPDSTTYGGDGRVFGVAPQADLVSVAIGDSQYAWGDGSTTGAWYSLAVAALQWTYDHIEEYDIRVVLNAWICQHGILSIPLLTVGAGCSASTVSALTKNLYDARAVVVFAVGEPGDEDAGRDSWSPYAIAVGAYDDVEKEARFTRPCSEAHQFSNNCPPSQDPESETLGPTRQGPDIMAPGVDIWAARTLAGTPVGRGPSLTIDATDDHAGRPRTEDDRPYEQLSGTSMAAAHVAGAAALLLEACPSAHPLGVMRALFAGANNTTFGDAYDMDKHGFGALDVRASLTWFLEKIPECSTSVLPKIEALEWQALGVPFAGTEGRGGTEIIFTATASDEDGKVVEWQWDFGDGNGTTIKETASSMIANHIYEKAGTYTVSLIIVDDAGARDFRSLPVRVFEKPEGQPSGPIRIDVNCLLPQEADGCPAEVLWIQDLRGENLDGSGSQENPFVLENLEIVVEAAYNKNLSVHAYETTRTSNSNDRGLDVVGIDVVNTGSYHLLIRNVSIHTNHSVDPHPDDVRVHHYGMRIRENVDALVRVENVFLCGTEERPLRGGLEIEGDGNELANVTVCNATEWGIKASGKANDLRDCYILSGSPGLSNTNDDDVNATTCPRPLALPEVGNITAEFFLDTPGVIRNNEYEVAIIGEDAQLVDASATPGSIPVTWRWQMEGRTVLTTDHTKSIVHTFDPDVTSNCKGAVPSSFVDEITLNVTNHIREYDEASSNVCVTHRPVADFRMQKQGGMVILTAECDSNDADVPCAFDPDTDNEAPYVEALNYTWNFTRDGKVARGNLTDPTSMTLHTSEIEFLFDEDGDFEVTLEVRDPFGAVHKTSKSGTISAGAPEPPLAQFSVVSSGTTQDPVILEDQSRDSNGDPLILWKWIFGDDSILEVDADDLQACPSDPDFGVTIMCMKEGKPRVYHWYGAADTYSVKLGVEAIDLHHPGMHFSFPVNVEVLNDLPTPIFEVTRKDGGSPLRTLDIIVFNATDSFDHDGSVDVYSWDVDGDGIEDSDQAKFEYVYEENNRKGGAYPVNLTITDNEGGVSFNVLDVVIENVPPVAAFGWSPELPTTEDTVRFTDGSFDQDFGFITGVSWDFGENNGSTQVNPRHQFPVAGEYEVNLTVTDDGGGIGWVVHNITVVNKAPTVAFAMTPEEPTVLDTIRFTSHSRDASGIGSTSWDFGDGNTSTGMAVEHQYAEPGRYDVNLTVVDLEGEANWLVQSVVVLSAAPVAVFTASSQEVTTADEVTFTETSFDPDGVVVAWHWDFGDGDTSTARNVMHRFLEDGPHDVTLTVTDDAGRTNATSRRVDVANLPPAAHPTASPAVPELGQVVRFDANATDPDGTIISYHWDFGDGAVGTGSSPEHAYPQKGAHVVVLTVMDDDGTLTASQVVVRVGNIPPQATFTHAPAQPTTSDDVTFQASADDEDGTISSWRWDFGDGQTSTRRNPTHSFDRSGTYTIRLVVADSDGDTHRVERNVTVQNTSPAVDFEHHPSNPTTQDIVRFRGQADDADGFIASWLWDFGDSENASRDTVEHRFTSPGAYNVRLTATDDQGEARTAQHVINVQSVPPVALIQADKNGDRMSFLFHDRSRDADGDIVARQWDLGDGTIAEGEKVEHNYAEPGAYVVTLTVKDGDGEATTFVTVVAEGPPASFLSQGEDRELPLSPLTAAAGFAAALALRRRRT